MLLRKTPLFLFVNTNNLKIALKLYNFLFSFIYEVKQQTISEEFYIEILTIAISASKLMMDKYETFILSNFFYIKVELCFIRISPNAKIMLLI
jgi:hypothetical protein